MSPGPGAAVFAVCNGHRPLKGAGDGGGGSCRDAALFLVAGLAPCVGGSVEACWLPPRGGKLSRRFHSSLGITNKETTSGKCRGQWCS